MKINPRILSLTLLVALLLQSCAFRNFGGGAQLTINSTADAIRTQAVATALAELATQAGRLDQPTATPVPSPTTAPSATVPPLPILTPAPTQALPSATLPPARVYPTYTATPAQTDFTCAVEEIEPATSETEKVGTQFDFNVRLKNSGQKSWQPGKILFMYTSGQKMQTKTSVVVLTSQIDVDGETVFSVPMAAPDTAGAYKTTWALYNGTLFFCPVHFQVAVSK